MTLDTAYGAALAASYGLGVALGRTRLMEGLLREKRLIMTFPDLLPVTTEHAYYADRPRTRQPSAILLAFLHWLDGSESA